MSWKKIATVAACALLATPALAQPSLQINSSPTLNGDGNWVWNVQVTPDDGLFSDNPPQGNGGSVAVEIGIEATGAGLVSVTPNATDFDNTNPGTAITGFPNGAGVNSSGDLISAFLGSVYFTSGGGKALLEVITEGPSTTGSLTSSLVVSGAYAGDSGRIAQAAVNYDSIAGTASRTAKAADANLDGSVNGLDLSTLATNFGLGGKHWGTADFNGDGTVNGLDLSILATNFGQSGGSNTPLDVTGVAAGSGGAAGAAVPEPASIALAGFALLAGLGLIRRK